MERDFSDMATRLETELETRLHVKGTTLDGKLRRVGRRAPRWVRRDLRVVADAGRLSEHPRLIAQIPRDEVEAAFRRAEGWFKQIDPAARRRQFLRGMAAGLAFNLLLATGLGIAALAFLGLIGP